MGDVRAMPAATADARLERGVGGVERDLVGALAGLHRVARLGVRRPRLRAAERVDDAALDAARRARDDVDDHDVAQRIVGAARRDRDGGRREASSLEDRLDARAMADARRDRRSRRP